MTSTFFNRNSYAAYAGMGMLCATAYMLDRWRRLWRDSSGYFFWRDFLSRLLEREIYWLALPVIFLIAVTLTASRAGFASTMAGLATLLLALAINRRLPIVKTSLVSLGLLTVCAVLLFFIGGDLVDRLGRNMVNEDLGVRLSVYELTWEAIKSNPWLGYGLGNFDTAFRLFRDPSVIGWFQEAHNEYLEIMMDLGIPAAIVWFTGLGLLFWRCAHGVLTRKRDGILPALALAVTVLEGAHSVLDFSLQIPAIAITYAALLGLGVAQSRSQRDERGAA
jgi:O-antigen ligase